MRIENSNSALLSNYEVLKLVRARQSLHKSNPKTLNPNTVTVCHEVPTQALDIEY
jgi:hypothetical protein